jgi:hypothetical protein
MSANINELSARELLDYPSPDVQLNIDYALTVVESQVRQIVAGGVEELKDWRKIRDMKVRDLFQAPSGDDGKAIQSVKRVLNGAVLIRKAMVDVMDADEGVSPFELYTEAVEDKKVSELFVRTKTDGFFGFVFRPIGLPVGETVIDRVVLELCDTNWTMKVRKHCLTTRRGIDVDYFEVSLYQGRKLVGLASGTYVLGQKEIDGRARKVSDEISDMIDDALVSSQQTTTTWKGGTLIVSNLELLNEYQGNNLEAYLTALFVTDVLQKCDRPKSCILLAHPIQYETVHKELVPRPIRKRFENDVKRSVNVANETRRLLMDSVVRNHKEAGLSEPVKIYCFDGKRIVSESYGPGRGTSSQAVH